LRENRSSAPPFLWIRLRLRNPARATLGEVQREIYKSGEDSSLVVVAAASSPVRAALANISIQSCSFLLGQTIALFVESIPQTVHVLTLRMFGDNADPPDMVIILCSMLSCGMTGVIIVTCCLLLWIDSIIFHRVILALKTRR
jgi:hypothetical protein